MAELGFPFSIDTRLTGIELPGMEIENERLTVTLMDPPYGPGRIKHRQEDANSHHLRPAN